MHSSLIGKVEKANRYARELDRVSIDQLSLTFRGDNDTHHVTLNAGQWRCTSTLSRVGAAASISSRSTRCWASWCPLNPTSS